MTYDRMPLAFFCLQPWQGAFDGIGDEVKGKASILAFNGSMQIQNTEQFVSALRIGYHKSILTPKTAILQNVDEFDKKVCIINSPLTRAHKNWFCSWVFLM